MAQSAVYCTNPAHYGFNVYKRPIYSKDMPGEAVWCAWERAQGASAGGHESVLSTTFPAKAASHMVQEDRNNYTIGLFLH